MTAESDDLDALIAAIDESPGKGHLDITPAVTALGDLGLPAAERVIELLNAPAELTRLHAQRALESIVNSRLGFRSGSGFPDDAAERHARSLWSENGDYQYDAPPATRETAIARWRAWLGREANRANQGGRPDS